MGFIHKADPLLTFIYQYSNAQSYVILREADAGLSGLRMIMLDQVFKQ